MLNSAFPLRLYDYIYAQDNRLETFHETCTRKFIMVGLCGESEFVWLADENNDNAKKLPTASATGDVVNGNQHHDEVIF